MMSDEADLTLLSDGQERRVVERDDGRPFAEAVQIYRPDHDAVVVTLDPRKRYLLGRTPAAQIALASPRVSREHGVLEHDGVAWFYRDLASANGSAFAGDCATARDEDEIEAIALDRSSAARLRVGDLICIGGFETRIVFEARPPRRRRDDSDDTRSSATIAFEQKLDRAAKMTTPVFLLGPSGAGKTWAARQIHERGDMRGAFLSTNCARLPSDATALRSELLGHRRGAFTGAIADRIGTLHAADRGTLFLDEVESLNPLAQGFLLDMLEETGDPSPLGAPPLSGRYPKFRLISASKLPLLKSGLRGDLCERLAAGHMWAIPTLDQRREDIPALIAAFAATQAKLLGQPVVIGDDVVLLAQRSQWPGQIRQLESTLRVLVQSAALDVASGEPVVLAAKALADHLQQRERAFGSSTTNAGSTTASAPVPKNPRALTADDIRAALDAEAGNRSAAARRLGIARNTLLAKIRQFDVENSQ